MMNINISWIALLVFFAAALLPLGQTDFMINHWMKLGAYITPLLIFFAFQIRANSRAPMLGDIHLVSCLLAGAYLLHQVEEHWIDLLGREYPLYALLNSMIAQVFGEETYGVFTPQAIFYVNVGAVWTIAFVAIASAPRHIFPAIAMAGLVFVNGISHIMVALRSMEYNSGLATSVILFVPLTVVFFNSLIKNKQASPQIILAGLVWGAIAHVLLFAGLIAANIYGVVSVWVYYTGLILYGFSPASMFRKRGSGSKQIAL